MAICWLANKGRGKISITGGYHACTLRTKAAAGQNGKIRQYLEICTSGVRHVVMVLSCPLQHMRGLNAGMFLCQYFLLSFAGMQIELSSVIWKHCTFFENGLENVPKQILVCCKTTNNCWRVCAGFRG
jgi:hypothetical protein